MNGRHGLTSFLMALALSGGLAAAQTTETTERTLQVPGTPEIKVRNEDGRTNLRSNGGSTVEVRVAKEVLHAASEEEARELAEQVDVRIEEVGGLVHVETIYPEDRWSFWRDDARVLVHIDIVAPRRSDLDVESEDGELTVQGFEGRIRLVSEDGGVRVSDSGGELDVTSEDGDVELTSVRGGVRARLEDGDLMLEGVVTDLDATSEDGTLDIRLAPGSRMGSEWTLRAQDGRITLQLPADFAASLDVRVDDGSIHIDHSNTSGTRLSDEHWTADLNGGGERLSVRTEDGSVRIRES